MVQSNIKVFLRIRPSARPSKGFSTPAPDPEAEEQRATVVFERDKMDNAFIDNTKKLFKFTYDGILSMKVSQEEVFNLVAKPVIEDVLNGINGTIFAYGMTGSGKTYTITGSADRYEDRGLIPRTISYLFQAFQRGDAAYKLYISYLEIYNDNGYDLIARGEDATKLDDLPKIQLRSDDEGLTHLRNLTVNVAHKEEDALNLLLIGDTNRQVAETPMNDASTRSHCMFVLHVDSTKHDSDTVRRAKLHLVDLAGSERISKTGVEGSLMKEATYINVSLFHLESVIKALQERGEGHRTHVPYRNSTMTAILRDSLGGNCKTVMVGTVAVEDVCMEETLSTCRFAQRVSCIRNNANVNEELDPALLIKRLKKQVGELKDELRLLGGSEEEDDLTEGDIEECRQLVSGYLEETDPSRLFVCGSAGRFRECFKILREAYWHRLEEVSGGQGTSRSKLPGAPFGGGAGRGGGGGGVSGGGGGSGAAVVGSLEATVMELRRQVAKRDDEIGILVNSLGAAGSKQEDIRNASRSFVCGSGGGVGAASVTGEVPGSDVGGPRSAGGASGSAAIPKSAAATGVLSAESAALLLDRNKAFEVFRKSVRRSELVDDNKRAMTELMAEAKALGEKANAARSAVGSRQQRIEKLRTQRTLETSPRVDGSDPTPPPDTPEITALMADIKEHKATYQASIQRLQKVKAELGSYQAQAAQNKERLQRDFEAWFRSLQAAESGGASASGTPTTASVDDLRSSMLSQASSADSCARSTPARRPSPAPAPGRPPLCDAGRSSPPAQPKAGAWEPPRFGASHSPVAAAAAAGVPPRPTSTRATSSVTTPSATTPAAVKATGHVSTDNDIAALYAAMAQLES
eukprot:TRINITY_DN51010_c0_g1_i1.p1 TRINITY_DN51010_c0_g1~~TRINITY_DN51010_c0_g1_i1.p1  ORF type:complete len:861 (+),score=182.55 TRINITY_DN51010_c0_g1_i1:264-2846(+)